MELPVDLPVNGLFAVTFGLSKFNPAPGFRSLGCPAAFAISSNPLRTTVMSPQDPVSYLFRGLVFAPVQDLDDVDLHRNSNSDKQ